MHQLSTHDYRFLLTLAAVLFILSCKSPPLCPALAGHWTNHEGQDFVFQENGKALWLLKFGSQTDTLQLDYRLDCTPRPVTLDFFNFQNGPHFGKTLFGILEWSSDSSFRLRYEVGMQVTERPVGFDSEQTMKFFRE